MRTRSKVIGAGAVIAALAAGGSAFTDSNTFAQSTTTAGYGNVSVTGATISSVNYNLSTDGQNIDSVALKFVGDQTNNNIVIGFGTPTDGSNPITLATCDDSQGAAAVPVYDGANSTVTCTLTTPQNTVAAVRFDVAVSNKAV